MRIGQEEHVQASNFNAPILRRTRSRNEAKGEAVNQPSNRGCLTWAAWLLATVGALVFFLVVYFISRERTARFELSAKLERLAAQGMPIDDATMLQYHHQLTSSEHTQAWLLVLQKLTSRDFEQASAGIPELDPSVHGQIPGPDESWNSASTPIENTTINPVDPNVVLADQDKVRLFLTSTTTLHNDLSTLAKKHLDPNVKPVRLITHFESINTTLNTTQSMREAARLLSLRGKVAIFDRDSAQVRDCIESLLGCAAALQGEPLLVSQLVVIAVESMAIELLKQGLKHNALDEPDLLALAPRFANKIEISPQWRIALNGERGISLPVFANPNLVGEENATKIPIRAHDAIYFLDFMERAVSIKTDDVERFATEIKATEQALEEMSRSGILRSFDTILTNLMAPSINAAGNAFIRQAMENRIATIGIGIRLFEMQNGRLPNSLDELGTLVIDGTKLDPAALAPPGGKPFGYQLDGQEALLWGFDVFQTASTPDEPPSTILGTPYAEQNERWIWHLPVANPAK